MATRARRFKLLKDHKSYSAGNIYSMKGDVVQELVTDRVFSHCVFFPPALKDLHKLKPVTFLVAVTGDLVLKMPAGSFIIYSDARGELFSIPSTSLQEVPAFIPLKKQHPPPKQPIKRK